MYYGGFTYTEVYNLPIAYRVWFIKRINKEFQKGQDSDGNSSQLSRGSHQNTTQARQMTGMSRPEGPARTRRFT